MAVTRGRRPRTRTAVLRATETLLETTPLAQLSVARIIAAAGVGRTSFYEHFDSKEDVVVQLLGAVSAEVGAALEPLYERRDRSPDEALRAGLESLVATWAHHAPLMVAAAEGWPRVDALRTMWFSLQAQATERLAAIIDRDRAAGIAPGGADSRSLAASLVWTVERAMHVSARRAGSAELPQLVAPLHQLLVGAIYGRRPE
ncbi:MAG TPA: TetR/AcrR family transcriptional regulator [Streptosporangiaceae bacterium]|nr:TetR/AcrR family transcriptional regulator [Streptosporangiaceae bacterium]